MPCRISRPASGRTSGSALPFPWRSRRHGLPKRCGARVSTQPRSRAKRAPKLGGSDYENLRRPFAKRRAERYSPAPVERTRRLRMSVLIKGGRVITAADDYVGDVFIEGERISLIGES